METFVIYDENGDPLTEQVDLAFTFYALKDGTLVTGGSLPAISEVGNGRYGFTALADTGWYVVQAPGAVQQYQGKKLDADYEGFMLYDENGAPLTGAVAGISFLQYIDADEAPLTPPAVTEVGGGWYRFPFIEGARSVLSTGAIPAYEAFSGDAGGGGGGGGIPPTYTAAWSSGRIVVTFDRPVLDAVPLRLIENYALTSPVGVATVEVLSATQVALTIMGRVHTHADTELTLAAGIAFALDDGGQNLATPVVVSGLPAIPTVTVEVVNNTTILVHFAHPVI